MCRVTLVPLVMTGLDTPRPTRRAKYFATGEVNANATLSDYGDQMVCLAAAILAQPDLDFLLAQPDALVSNEDFDTRLTDADVVKARTVLEGVKIPANWINASNTWREVLRSTGGLFQFFQRYEYVAGGGFWTGVQLTSQWRGLPIEKQQGVEGTAASLNYNTAFISPNMNMRTIMKNFGDQWGAEPLYLGCATM